MEETLLKKLLADFSQNPEEPLDLRDLFDKYVEIVTKSNTPHEDFDIDDDDIKKLFASDASKHYKDKNHQVSYDTYYTHQMCLFLMNEVASLRKTYDITYLHMVKVVRIINQLFKILKIYGIDIKSLEKLIQALENEDEDEDFDEEGDSFINDSSLQVKDISTPDGCPHFSFLNYYT